MPVALSDLQTGIYDYFLAEGAWPPVRLLQKQYRAEGGIRTIAARFGKHEIVCQVGDTGIRFLPLAVVATLPRAGEDLFNFCAAVRFAESRYAEQGPEPISHADFRAFLKVDGVALRRLGWMLLHENFILTGGAGGSANNATFFLTPTERALFFDRIRDFSDYQERVAWVTEMERERHRLEALEREGQPPEPDGEFYFRAGEQFRARQRLFQIMTSALTDVLIVDSYLDPTVLDFADVVDDHVTVRLLAGTAKPLFAQQVQLLQARRSGIEARSSQPSHDRWLVIDSETVWHLGASINGLRKQASRISRLPSGPKTEAVLGDATQWWLHAKPI